MEFFKKRTSIPFMSQRWWALGLSGGLILISIGAILVRGLNLGLDFTGGPLVEVGYPEAVELGSVRQSLAAGGFNDATAQHFGTSRDVLVRIAPRKDMSSADLSTKVLNALNGTAAGKVDMRRIEFVGPQVGQHLTEQGGLAMLYALVGILIYVALRFQYRFAIASVLALVHDVIITVGVFSVFQVEFDLPVLAAVLAVIGYSLNDTIVVFDRIRENFRKMRKGSSAEVLDVSINQTLSRTLMTSGTTLLVVAALFIFGGGIIHGFALALLIGIGVGTYSSIYVASVAVLMMGISKADLMPVAKEGAEADNLP